MLYSILFKSDYLLFSKKSVPLQCVFHSIRFKINKGWSKALLLFYFIPLTFTIKQVFLLIQKPRPIFNRSQQNPSDRIIR
ncbi:hypothetical protein GAZ81_09250 [Phocaeicola vulgatus]|nr:hypothetical protein GAZ81_09250 [Phocaeicola vulgatus]